MHTFLWNEPPQVSYRVVFAEFEWKYHNFLNMKTGWWDLKVLLLNYWKDLLWDPVEAYFWKLVHTCLWNEPPQVCKRVVFVEYEWKYYIFLSIKTGKSDLKILLLNYWNNVVLGSVETNFLEFGAYVSLKRAATGVWEVCFCWIWMKIPQFFRYKNEGVRPKNFTV